MLMQTHPIYTGYRSLFTAFMVFLSFSPKFQDYFGLKGFMILMGFDTALLLHPKLFRKDLIIHHAFCILMTSTCMVLNIDKTYGYIALKGECISIFNFLRKRYPTFVTYWRVFSITMIRIPQWLWLLTYGIKMLYVMSFFFTLYDMYMLRILLPKIKIHPIYTGYRSLFTASLVVFGLFPYFQTIMKIDDFIYVFLFDTVLLFHPNLFRTDLFIHHSVVILFLQLWKMARLPTSTISLFGVCECISIFNFLRKKRPGFVTLWRLGAITFIRLPTWWLLWKMGHPLTITMSTFFIAYDMYMLQYIIPTARRILF